MRKGDKFLYRKKECVVLSAYKQMFDGVEVMEYAVKMDGDNSLHRFYEDENGKLKKII